MPHQLHLRYLDLSRNVKLKTLPNSITKLYNLQSLIMVGCSTWKEWPICFYKLVNLRLLDIRECPELTYMPLGIGQLTNLRDLTHFKVGTSSSMGNQFGGELKDIKSLVNLRGELDIRIFKHPVSYTENVWQGGYWEHIKNLKVLAINFNVKARPSDNEALIAKLQPSRNLMQLKLENYNGSEIPRWGRAEHDWAINLPNLVKIELEGIERLHGIPSLSNLKHLKFLSLFMSNSLEYMETRSRSKADLPFFPSLEHLSIWCLKRLKGWWGADSSRGGPHWQPPFPRLSTLIINSCPELTSFPPCPSLELLEVINSNKSLRIFPGEGPQNLDRLKLRVREIDSVGYLTTLPAYRLTHIMIKADQELRRLSEIGEVLKKSSSLQSLNINRCTRLTSVSGALEHLTALESLSLINIPAEVFDDEMPWKSLCHNLRSLELEFLNTIQILPTGMKHLTALQNISIIRCNSLKVEISRFDETKKTSQQRGFRSDAEAHCKVAGEVVDHLFKVPTLQYSVPDLLGPQISDLVICMWITP
ncbi:putative disease resistance protein At3g14460 [Silene latifolia]|uniref:putative disease resistance protein At3g14460 n=1 Tax=Silene latifolia TaxID=37657 RepID=UPI003D773431